MILRGKYLIDSAGRVVEDAEVVVEGDKIAAIRVKGAGPTASDSEVLDLGNVALLPGLVNAHTHLELSAAAPQVKSRPRFTDWLRQVAGVTSAWSDETFGSSLAQGIERSLRLGTTSLGDINAKAGDTRPYASCGMRAHLFYEIIDFNPKTAEASMESLKARIGVRPPEEDVFIGIAPHTPYTVSEQLLTLCVNSAHENNWRLCIHVAETEAEIEFLNKGTGDILGFRKDFGLPPDWKPPRTSPIRYLEGLGFLGKPATLIHCNYVPQDDFDMIGRSRSSVVFCPRSHRYFGHTNHPFLRMLESGINVALGTDSLLSSPTLGMLDEMRFVRREFPDIPPEVILKMATTNGLEALGFPADSIPLGRADLVGVALHDKDSARFRSLLDAVLSENSKVIFSMSGGKIVFDSRADTMAALDFLNSPL